MERKWFVGDKQRSIFESLWLGRFTSSFSKQLSADRRRCTPIQDQKIVDCVQLARAPLGYAVARTTPALARNHQRAPYRPMHALTVKSLIFDLRVSASICGQSCYSRFIRMHSRTGFSTGAMIYA
ncbi:hypothetical protein ACS8YF_09875 [Salinisphaera sp. SWV1]|uniref:hypothetical protein n=1 Tax=Salinisphaera sp. SWV1 TaxID=3454139 RepID=UPI003F824379